MNIPTTGQNSGKLFCLQKRIIDATKHNQPEEWGAAESYCGGESKWSFEDCSYIFYHLDKGAFFEPLAKELHVAQNGNGIYGFFSLGSAELAKEIMEKASQNGEFDYRDGYNTLLYRVRHEYRIVSVEFDIKVAVC